MTLADIEALYGYNRWANARLLGSTGVLAHELLTKDLGTSYGSIFQTLCHIAWGERLWLARCHVPMVAGSDESPLRCVDLTTLRSCWAEIERDQVHFISSLVPMDLDRLISYENPTGTRWTYSLRYVLQHVVNHSTYHRGQVAGMLRQIGSTPPATDFLLYVDEVVQRARLREDAVERTGP